MLAENLKFEETVKRKSVSPPGKVSRDSRLERGSLKLGSDEKKNRNVRKKMKS